ncbi:MAG: polyprenyl synthetase family protein, partial [Paludibacter sp.]|nr:polyprenyl synthetase family protein [Paludibacter sp.]
MLSIAEIRKPICTELQIFNKKFVQALATDNPLLNTIHDYVLESSGKQLRPILTLLSAKLCGEINDVSYASALSVEMLHNASLIHDDVVDDTPERRGRKSINSRWTNKVAVLSGDYMLSNALMLVVQTKNFEILREITQIGLELSDGELAQLANTEKSKITEDEYLAIVNKKTAVLFATCCSIGALSAGANAAQVENLRNFGKLLGLCFQIKDDVFDYFSNIEIGKPTRNDLQDGKITLPLIY